MISSRWGQLFQFIQSNYRNISTAQIKEKVRSELKAKAWQVHSYGDISELQASTIRIPTLLDPHELLINVEAASANPIDLLMLGGYGRTLFQIPRKCNMELPLTLGRDFCGTIMHKGHGVGDSFNVGDKVYGFVPIHKQGSFSEVVVATHCHIRKQPSHLTATESTSLVYASMTAWSALYIFGGLSPCTVKDARVLILGGSGGVGTAAIQLLKSQGCNVYATCSTDAVPLVRSLGADLVFDYTEKDYLEKVAMEGKYDIVVDCAKFGYDNVPKTWRYKTYVVLNSPLLTNTDQYGLFYGLALSANKFLQTNVRVLGDGKSVRWGFFVPSSGGLKFIDSLISQQKMQPVIHKEFAFNEIPEALKEVQKGHLRGKVVVNFEKSAKV